MGVSSVPSCSDFNIAHIRTSDMNLDQSIDDAKGETCRRATCGAN